MDNKTITELLNIVQKQKKSIKNIEDTKEIKNKPTLTLLDHFNPLDDNFNLFKLIDMITILGYIYSIYNTIILIFEGESIITQNIYYYLGVLLISLISILF